MEWIASLITAIDYVEGHLLEIPVAADRAAKVSTHVHMSPYSFRKRFHGISPTMARKREIPIQQFLPLKIKYSIQGGNNWIIVRKKWKISH